MFPAPLHLVRRVDGDTFHQYCAGNRVVTVSGQRVAIADYDKQQLTEIDRAHGTYSVTTFAELASAQPAIRETAAKSDWNAKALDGEHYELSRGAMKLDVRVDRRVTLSRDALDVLIGAAYPNPRRAEHDAIARAAAGLRDSSGLRQSTNSAQQDYALPAEQTVTIEAEGETITTHNEVVAVGNELPSPELLTIPPGAQRVESHALRLARELKQLDELPRTQR